MADRPHDPPTASAPIDLGSLVTRLQSQYIRGTHARQVFDALLPELLAFTQSEYGFIGELWHDEEGPFLKVFTLTNIAWDEPTRRLVEAQREQGLDFRNMSSLFGAAVKSGLPVIANQPATDPRRGGLPPGHPPLNTFLAVPLFQGGAMVGQVGLANRPGGYDEAMLTPLQPLFATVGSIMGQVQLERERRRAEQALRASEALYRATFESAAIGIAHVDMDGRYLEVNEHQCRILGRSAQQLRQLRFHDISHPDDMAADLELLDQLLDGRVPRYEMEKRFVRPDGSVVWTLLTVALLRDEAGRPQRVLSTLQDIDERKQLEQAHVAAEAAERASRAKTEFLSRMSHELRTPLNAVLGFAQLLRLDSREPLTDRQRGQLQHIEHAGQHLLSMINDVLDLSRIEEGSPSLRLVSVGIAAVAREAAALLQPAAEAAKVGIELHGDEAEAAWADADRLRQVLVNLISNAVKYNRPGGRVQVHWRAQRAGTLRIDVRDTGVGLSAQQRRHLFEPFNRLGAEQTRVQGSGIGLVITRGLLRLMQGGLEVDSEPGRGSCFTVTLPLAPARSAPASKGVEGSLPANGGAVGDVLYVEDNPMNLALVEELMTLRPALRLVSARSGTEALGAVARQRPALLLADWHLGDMDAAQLLSTLRAAPGGLNCPGVVLSADATPERREAARRAGFDAYLTKPFSLGELLQCLDAFLAPALSVGCGDPAQGPSDTVTVT